MTTPTNHKTTRDTAERLAQYQAEVLNKCEGRPANTKPPEWLLMCKIGWAVADEDNDLTEALVMQALESMQDARNNNLNPEMKHTNNLTRYYFATIRSMCRERGIDSGINWKE